MVSVVKKEPAVSAVVGQFSCGPRRGMEMLDSGIRVRVLLSKWEGEEPQARESRLLREKEVLSTEPWNLSKITEKKVEL